MDLTDFATMQRLVDYTAEALGAGRDAATKDAVASALAHTNTVIQQVCFAADGAPHLHAAVSP